MHLFLEILGGAQFIGKSIWLEPGDILTFGSGPKSDLLLYDKGVAEKAGTLMFNGPGTSLLNAHGVSIGERMASPKETLNCGAIVRVGRFRILLREYPVCGGGPEGWPIEELIRWMRQLRGNLYAIYDSARDTAILELLKEVETLPQASLFNGELQTSMADAAPYLVEISRDSAKLELLVRASWGRGWTTFLAAEMDFNAVRAQLRRSLMARLPSGEPAYFRYFDPAVLQAYLNCSNDKAWRELSGGIREFIVEDLETPAQMVRFYNGRGPGDQNRTEKHPLTSLAGAPPLYEVKP